MTLSITKTGAFLTNGNSISFIKGLNNVVNYINNNSALNVTMEVENANKFVKIFSQITNVKSDSINSELIKYGETLVTFKFNFKTI